MFTNIHNDLFKKRRTLRGEARKGSYIYGVNEVRAQKNKGYDVTRKMF